MVAFDLPQQICFRSYSELTISHPICHCIRALGKVFSEWFYKSKFWVNHQLARVARIYLIIFTRSMMTCSSVKSFFVKTRTMLKLRIRKLRKLSSYVQIIWKHLSNQRWHISCKCNYQYFSSNFRKEDLENF